MPFYPDWASRWIYRNAQQVCPFFDWCRWCLFLSKCHVWILAAGVHLGQYIGSFGNKQSMNFARQEDVMLQCWTLFCLSLYCQNHEGISENERSWPVFVKSEFHRKKRKCIFLTHGWVGRIRTISDCHCFWIQEEWSSLCTLCALYKHAVVS